MKARTIFQWTAHGLIDKKCLVRFGASEWHLENSPNIPPYIVHNFLCSKAHRLVSHGPRWNSTIESLERLLSLATRLLCVFCWSRMCNKNAFSFWIRSKRSCAGLPDLQGTVAQLSTDIDHPAQKGTLHADARLPPRSCPSSRFAKIHGRSPDRLASDGGALQ